MEGKVEEKAIAVLDFGSQYTQLIARRFRELGFYSEIVSWKTKDFSRFAGIVLSGGPASVYEVGAPKFDFHSTNLPLLGICYGMQMMAQHLGGKVTQAGHREYGPMKIHWKIKRQSKEGASKMVEQVWMSHGDVVENLPPTVQVLALSETGHVAAIQKENYLGLQYHPEVTHTENGKEILDYFASKMCNIIPKWSSQTVIDRTKQSLQDQKVSGQILCALSGGVDSSVLAVMLTQILGSKNVPCVFVNNGLLRKNEYEEVLAQYQGLGLNVRGIDASAKFLSALAGVGDPESKRKIIGRTFIEVFEAIHLPEVTHLAQGTLYPDVVESFSGTGVTIKTHHNVGGLPDKMKLKVFEPFRDLFKDEVRSLGSFLKIPSAILQRHPFPGPGLGVRIMGEITQERLDLLRDCDKIYIDYLKAKNLYDRIWQAFCVLPGVRNVGVQGDGRTYREVVGLRAVTSFDGMTAEAFEFEMKDLKAISSLITNQVSGVNRVVYDITSKPPATFEWE